MVAPSHSISMKPTPPNWGADELTNFITETIHNKFGTYVNYTGQYNSLQKIDDLFRQLSSSLINTRQWFESFFFLRCHSAFLASAGLAMSGQVVESYATMRVCLEYALYGFYINKGPKHSSAGSPLPRYSSGGFPLYEIWLNKNTNRSARKRFDRIFTPRRILTYIKRHYQSLYGSAEKLYVRTIESGAHPNPDGTLASIDIQERPGVKLFNVGYLQGNSDQTKLAIKSTAQVGVTSFKLFERVYFRQTALLNTDDKLRRICNTHNL